MPFVRLKDKNGDVIRFQQVNGKLYGIVCDEEILGNMHKANIRTDDVMICAYMRSGTHWTYEMTHMLLKGAAETVCQWKGAEQFEFTPCEDLDSLPSPRVLNTHLPHPDLPPQVSQVKPKILYLMRDPRDVAVSNYFISTGFGEMEYKGTFDGFLDLFLEGNVMYGSWFDYVNKWDEVIDSGEFDVLVLHYEDTHKDPMQTVRRICEFLGLEREEKLLSEIVSKCGFERMREDKRDYTFLTADGENVIFRKGQVSDWKNWFTVEMSERFDQVMNDKMKNSKLAQRYLH